MPAAKKTTGRRSPSKPKAAVEMRYVDRRRPPPSGLHVDKSVGILGLLAILVQISGGIWYASSESSRLMDHDRRIAALELSTNESGRRIEDGIEQLKERTARIEEHFGILTQQPIRPQ